MVSRRQPCLGPGSKSEALGRRPGEAGHVPPPPPHGLGSLAASSVFPRGETWFLLAAQGLLGRKSEPASSLVELEAGGTGAVVLWESGGPSPPTRTGVSQEGESCQVTCRGQHEPEAPTGHLTQEEAGRGAQRRPVDRGQPPHVAWARVCTSCCRQLAEASAHPHWSWGRGEDPLAGPYPCTQSQGPRSGGSQVAQTPGSPAPLTASPAVTPFGGDLGSGPEPWWQLYPGSRSHQGLLAHSRPGRP